MEVILILKKEGRKEERREGRKEGREEGRKKKKREKKPTYALKICSKNFRMNLPIWSTVWIIWKRHQAEGVVVAGYFAWVMFPAVISWVITHAHLSLGRVDKAGRSK